MNPILIDISAILNTGKFMIFKFIKSITKPLNILSIPLPKVPPRKKVYEYSSIGYLLTPNFGYLLGLYPLIIIIDNLNTINKINVGNFLKNGFIAIGAMHLTGILYNFIQIIFYSQYNLFLYNLGKYSLGKIGYHFLMLFPLLLLIKPIERLKRSK